MKSAHRGIFFALLLCLTNSSGAVDLVVNENVPIETLSRSTVRSVFSMRMTSWPDGVPIQVFVMGDKTKLHASFSKEILGVFPHQLRRAWNRQIFAGTGQAPAKVDTEQEMLDKVATTPGAIGYISKELINEQIRKIAVE
ncbi:MAG: substrate-binding domain-containing protein [Candidatus Thiodiazotropha sp. (ex Notomyrtea botanica)]|nr:substrate-binding domain-containing protein [Candidatus Thiodiazotropha sp. (ex Notomyrtea botanica)]